MVSFTGVRPDVSLEMSIRLEAAFAIRADVSSGFVHCIRGAPVGLMPDRVGLSRRVRDVSRHCEGEW